MAGRKRERWNELMLAANQGQVERAKSILEKGEINPNATTETYQSSALILAVIGNCFETFKVLFEHPEVDTRLTDCSGWNALMWAADLGHEKILKFILDGDKDKTHPKSKIDVNFRGKKGNTALLLAASKGRTSVFQLLYQHPGVDREARDNTGYNALMWAAEKGSTEIAEFLLGEKDVHVSCTDQYGNTALLLAALKGHTQIFHTLYQHPKVNREVRNRENWTAAECAKIKGHPEILRCFQDQDQCGPDGSNTEESAEDSSGAKEVSTETEPQTDEAQKMNPESDAGVPKTTRVATSPPAPPEPDVDACAPRADGEPQAPSAGESALTYCEAKQ